MRAVFVGSVYSSVRPVAVRVHLHFGCLPWRVHRCASVLFALSVCLLTLCECSVCAQRGLTSVCVEDVAHHGSRPPFIFLFFFYFKPLCVDLDKGSRNWIV